MVLVAAVAVFAVLVLVGRYEVGGYRSLASQPVAVSALVLVSVGVCLSTLRAEPRGWQVPLVVATLTVFPLAEGLGSTVPYVYLAIADAPFWLLAAVIVSCSRSSVARHRTAVACTGGIWLLTTTIAWTGLVSSPTRVWTPLWEQTEAAPGRELRGVLVDVPSAQFMADVSTIVDANWLDGGRPLLLGFEDLPGPVLYADATTLAGGWFFSFTPARTVLTLDRECRRPAWEERTNEPLLLVRDFNMRDETLALLQRCGIDFPDEYRLVGSLEQPMGYYPFATHVTVWAPEPR